MKINEIKDFCEKHSLTIDQFYGKEEIKGDLILNYIKVLPEGFKPTVEGALYLNSITELPEGFNPTVGGSLDLRSVTKIPDGFKPIVSGNLYLNSVIEIPDGFSPIVSGSLHLSSVTTLPNNFNPIVGWELYLNCITELPNNFKPIVSGSLYLISINEIPDGFNPTVGENIYYDKSSYKKINHEIPILSWENGKYIKVDGIFCEVLHKKDNIFKCKHITKKKPFYIVSDSNDTYAHGESIKEAQSDLLYKLTERNVDGYKNLTLDSILTHDDAVICYRVITGACSFGTNDFLENILGDNSKESYTINEIIQLTENQYGNITFKDFFNV